MRCPLCGRQMTKMAGVLAGPSVEEPLTVQEPLYYCEKHGVMNKPGDLKEKADQIEKRV